MAPLKILDHLRAEAVYLSRNCSCTWDPLEGPSEQCDNERAADLLERAITEILKLRGKNKALRAELKKNPQTEAADSLKVPA